MADTAAVGEGRRRQAALDLVGGAGGWLLRALIAERERWPLWLPVGIGAGVAAYFALDTEPPFWLGPVAAAGLCAACIAVRERPPAFAAAMALLAFAAGFAAAPGAYRQRCSPTSHASRRACAGRRPRGPG